MKTPPEGVLQGLRPRVRALPIPDSERADSIRGATGPIAIRKAMLWRPNLPEYAHRGIIVPKRGSLGEKAKD
jgi:hypothetical protein